MESRTTVIVVAYNHERFVEECLETIRGQDHPAARVLVADDCSPDGTVEVVRAYQKRYPGFCELHTNRKNRGLTATLNSMLTLVDTPYVTYIAADDFMLPSRIRAHERLLDAASPDVVLAYSDARVVDAWGCELGLSSDEYPWPDEPMRTDQVVRCLLEGNWIPAASFFMRTALLKSYGGYCDDIFFEDYELLMRLGARASFVYVDEPLVGVRRLEDSLGSVGFKGDSPRFIKALYVATSRAKGVSRETDAVVYPRLWELARRAQRAGLDRAEVLRWTWESRTGAPTIRSLVKGLVLAAVSRQLR